MLYGYFPQDAALVKKIGTGVDVFMSKNTLKRGYVHPDAETKAKPRIDLGMRDEDAVRMVFGLLKPGACSSSTTLARLQRRLGNRSYRGAMGAAPSPATRTSTPAVLAYDVDDSKMGRAVAKTLEWGSDAETIHATLTLVRRPKR